MTTAIDSSILLDILIDDPLFSSMSEAALKRAKAAGRIIVCESVIAEIRPALSSDGQLREFLDDLHLEFVPSNVDAAMTAGALYARYLKNRGTAKRVLPDFLIASHASQFADALLARDRGYYRHYFKELSVIDPAQ
jgi:predicted nucleic acid-binding protein